VEALRSLTADPARAALFFDVDGTLAPIVQRAQDAQVPKETSLLLARLSRRYASVACISGRSAADVRRLVGVGGIAYAGSHGAELLEPGETAPRIAQDFQRWEPKVKAFASARDTPALRALRVRIEDKGAIVTFHWRGAPDEASARAHVERLAQEAESAGLWTHWGRKVLEIRPPVRIDKGAGIVSLLRDTDLAAAVYVGDDMTDIDAFRGLTELVEMGRLGTAVRIGVRSEEGPSKLADEADAMVEGTDGVRELLKTLLA
jgi:trehalose 6-phosphate phosphatase